MSHELDSYVDSYGEFNDWLTQQRYRHLQKHFRGTECLELGPGTGKGTAFLLDHFTSVVTVDGSQRIISRLRERFAGRDLTAICCYFEQLHLDRQFQTVVLAHVLEHVDDPQAVLAVARRHLDPEGVMIVDVPNAMSLHRQVGVELGLLGAVTELHEGDLSIGHKRVYTPDQFRAEIRRADLEVHHFGGVFLKLLSNAQTRAVFDPDQLQALLALGVRYPEIAAEVYVIARCR